MATVFLLWHENPDSEDGGMLLGVYSTAERARARQADAVRLPGFRRYPNEFVIDAYEVDTDKWIDGFITQLPDGTWVEDPEPAI